MVNTTRTIIILLWSITTGVVQGFSISSNSRGGILGQTVSSVSARHDFVSKKQSHNSLIDGTSTSIITHSRRSTSNNAAASTSSMNRHTSTTTSLHISPLDEDEKENVNVNLVDNVDSFTLTAVGFGLIAFNFLVFANMGDVGLGGMVARIINAFT